MKAAHKRLNRAYLDLQEIVDKIPGGARQQAGTLRTMGLINDLAIYFRSKAIFTAGAKARKPEPKFEGETLGSMESMTFYDGFASTHPGFVNPYRRGR